MNEKIKKKIKATKLFHAYDKYRIEKAYFSSYEISHKMVSEQSIDDFIKWIWKRCMKCELNLDNPETFNEKLQWLKLNWYDERVQMCVDKNLVRDYIKNLGLEELLIPQLAVYEHPEDIDISMLPDKFVLKPSHDSGHTFICTDKSKFDVKKVKKQLKKYLNVDYEFMSGEWAYATPHKTIVCEKFLEDKKVGELLDYKFFCFNGEPKYVFFVSDRAHHARSDFYDMNWNLQDFRWYYEPSGKTFPKPSQFEKMKEYAKILAADFPFVRVDLYEINGKVYFGELTFFHGGGLGWFRPESKDKDFGDLLTLPPVSNPKPWEVIHPELGRNKK